MVNAPHADGRLWQGLTCGGICDKPSHAFVHLWLGSGRVWNAIKEVIKHVNVKITCILVGLTRSKHTVTLQCTICRNGIQRPFENWMRVQSRQLYLAIILHWLLFVPYLRLCNITDKYQLFFFNISINITLATLKTINLMYMGLLGKTNYIQSPYWILKDIPNMFSIV